jgi:hypothetical protein
VGFVVDKVTLGQVSPSISISYANFYSIDCSTLFIIYRPGLIERAKQWPVYEVDSVSPHPKALKLINYSPHKGIDLTDG